MEKPMTQGHRRNTGSRNKTALKLETLEDRWMPAVIGGIVYLDANNNGLYDSGEQGLGPSSIQLRDSAGTLIATTSSNPTTGLYQFTQRDPSTIQPATLVETATFAQAPTNQSR